MTVTKIYFKNNHFHHLVTSGHSGYADSGSDIVCSAITSAHYTVLNIFDNQKIKMKYQTKEDGYLELEVFESNDLIDQCINGLIDTLKNIEENYPKNFKITLKEEK